MKVKIIASTTNPIETIYRAYKQCYAPGTAREVKIPSSEEMEKFIKKWGGMGHLSPWEHVSFTFSVEGVSRALTHQLVRHRIASYNQQSQRYQSCFGKSLMPMPLPDGEKRNGHCKFTINQEKFIAKQYEKGLSSSKIAELYKMNRGTVLDIVKIYSKARTQKESKFIKENFFEQIDSHLKAKILGFIYSDGNIGIKKNGDLILSIEQLEDEYMMLYNIVNTIKKDGKVIKSGHENTIRISIQNNKICNDLIKYGIVPRKAKIINMEKILKNIDNQFLKSFVLGVFEGDGHLSSNKNGTNLNITGTYETCKTIQNIICDELLVKRNKILKSTKGEKTYVLNFTTKEQVITILKWMYSEAKAEYCHVKKIKKVLELVPELKEKFDKQFIEYIEKNFNCNTPQSIIDNKLALGVYVRSLVNIKEAYSKLQFLLAKSGQWGQKANEDARSIIPNAFLSNIVVTMNLRSLRHFYEERSCKHAQAEIRELANNMMDLVKEIIPFADYKAKKCGITCFECTGGNE